MTTTGEDLGAIVGATGNTTGAVALLLALLLGEPVPVVTTAEPEGGGGVEDCIGLLLLFDLGLDLGLELGLDLGLP